MFGCLGLFTKTALFIKCNCESFDKPLAAVNHCRLKPIRRYISKFYLNITILEKVYKVKVNGDWKRNSNGYKPFLYNFTADCCSFMENKDHVLFNLIYKLFKDFSNINHTCPFYGDQILDGFYSKTENIMYNLPIPDGEYAISLTEILNDINVFVTNVFFEIYTK